MHHRIASAGLSVAVLFGATAFAQDPLHLWQAPEYWSPSLATIGDTNGDGGSELAIGGFSLSGHPPGFVHLRSGITGAILKSFSDTTPESYFGEAMAAAGDVDQDGAPDIVVGAWGRDDNGVDSGRVFVFSSASSGPAAPLFAIDGGPGDALGYGVSGGVDLDGDGVPDLRVLISSDTAVGQGPPLKRVGYQTVAGWYANDVYQLEANVDGQWRVLSRYAVVTCT